MLLTLLFLEVSLNSLTSISGDEDVGDRLSTCAICCLVTGLKAEPPSSILVMALCLYRLAIADQGGGASAAMHGTEDVGGTWGTCGGIGGSIPG